LEIKITKETKAIVYVLVALAIFVAAAEYAKTIDVEAIDQAWLQTVVIGLKEFFTKTPVALAVALCRNMLGYLANRFRDPKVEYEIAQLGETWAEYEAGILILSQGLPLGLSVAATFLVEVISRAIKKLKQPTAS